MPTIVDCPACQRKLRVPDDLLGKQVKCPQCGDTFAATAQAEPPPPLTSQPETLAFTPGAGPSEPSLPDGPTAPGPQPSPAQEKVTARPVSPEPARPPDERGYDREYCPRCDKPMRRGERRCRHCGEELDDEDDRPWERGATRRDSEPHRGPLVLTLGIISIVDGAISLIGCPYLSVFGLGLGIPTWVMGQRDLNKMRSGLKDPRGQPQTQAGWICAIVGTVLSILAFVVAIFLTVIYGFLIFGAMSAKPPAGKTSVPATSSAPGNPPKLFFERGVLAR
jgi:predicted Zn finger-like uncharacterized protein